MGSHPQNGCLLSPAKPAQGPGLRAAGGGGLAHVPWSQGHSRLLPAATHLIPNASTNQFPPQTRAQGQEQVPLSQGTQVGVADVLATAVSAEPAGRPGVARLPLDLCPQPHISAKETAQAPTHVL